MAIRSKQSFDVFLNGDKNGVDQIYPAYYRKIYLYCHRILKDEMLAENVTVDCFGILLEKIGMFESSTHVVNYLFIIARNQSLKVIRNLQARRKSGLPELVYDFPRPEEVAGNESSVRLDVLEQEVAICYWNEQVMKLIDRFRLIF